MKEKNKSVSSKYSKPDFEDPFAPAPDSIVSVKCLHCGDTYPENQIRWDSKQEIWVCKNHPGCHGSGFGWDIFHEADFYEI